MDDFPNRNQEYTSEDGQRVASNVPVEWNVEAYVSAGDGAHAWLVPLKYRFCQQH